MSLKEIWAETVRIVNADIRSTESIDNIDNFRITVSIAVGILTAIILGVLTRRKIVTRKKQKELAIQTGKVIKAKCVQVYKDYDTDENTGVRNETYHGVYEYTVNGKTKRYRVFGRGDLPRVFLPLYYANSPKKVFSDYDNIGLNYNLSILLGILSGVLTMFLTDYIFY